jgi:hypothetical protein
MVFQSTYVMFLSHVYVLSEGFIYFFDYLSSVSYRAYQYLGKNNQPIIIPKFAK